MPKNKDTIKQNPQRDPVNEERERNFSLPAKVVAELAEEVAKVVISRIPNRRPTKKKKKKNVKFENAYFLDTSAIIDGRIFDVLNLGLISGNVIVLESILSELKHIADSQDAVKREKGKKGLTLLDRVKKVKGVKLVVLQDKNDDNQPREVDEKLIRAAKDNKGKIITCDFNLEKKASISGITAINVHSLANHLKVRAVPGEALHIKVLHKGKDAGQGVGYLDDGTMLVVENSADDLGKYLDVIVSRVIQTTAGRILFAKKI